MKKVCAVALHIHSHNDSIRFLVVILYINIYHIIKTMSNIYANLCNTTEYGSIVRILSSFIQLFLI